MVISALLPMDLTVLSMVSTLGLFISTAIVICWIACGQPPWKFAVQAYLLLVQRFDEKARSH
jgi:hypothetical protein